MPPGRTAKENEVFLKTAGRRKMSKATTNSPDDTGRIIPGQSGRVLMPGVSYRWFNLLMVCAAPTIEFVVLFRDRKAALHSG
jgi:hypothetical protein